MNMNLKKDNRDIREIDEIQFGIYSAEEIIKMSVVEITLSKLSSTDKGTAYNTVYDPRLGTIENKKICETCNKDAWNCSGHYGYIKFVCPILHPLHYKRVIDLLRCFCLKCFKMRISAEQIMLSSFSKSSGIRRFNKIMDNLDKKDICFHCMYVQPEIKFVATDTSVAVVYKQKDKTKITIPLTVEEIKSIFDNISDEDVKLLGFDPTMMHPRNLIITVFPVLPINCRPYIVSADGNICDDDLTIQITEIIKINNKLKLDDTFTGINNNTKKDKLIQTLKFRVSTFYNNSSSRARHSAHNSRPLKGLKERITGKEGTIRSCLLGKRCDMTCRTVIGPDPTLKLGQVVIPEEIARNLIIPDEATKFNIAFLTNIVNTNRANFLIKKGTDVRINLEYKLKTSGTILKHGDIIKRKIDGVFKDLIVLKTNEILKVGDRIIRDGIELENVQYPEKRFCELEIGDIVERHLMDGDIVIINRQPTLHMGSMLGHEILVRPGRTIRLNLAITKSLNADFDGDECNAHIPASIEAQAELRYLSECQTKIISPQSSKNIICIVQDSLLGAYKMTLGIQQIRKEQFFNIIMYVDTINPDFMFKKLKLIQQVLKSKGKPTDHLYTGRNLFSLLLPDDLIYEKKNNANPDEPIFKIYNGVLYEGTVDKSIIGSANNSLIQILYKEYNSQVAANFIDGIQFMTNQWLLIKGFSVGIEDCMIKSAESKLKIQDIIQKCYIEAEGIKNSTKNKNIKEIRITAALSKAQDIGMSISKQAIEPSNNFISTIKSGSKATFFNLAQLTGLVSQQNIDGKRIMPSINNCSRTLPHYPFENLSLELEYESQGFIKSSFCSGLNPREFYFHAMSGRSNCSDTAMGTPLSGYMERRITKILEDARVQNDGTIRDTLGNIYQNSYDTGIDPVQGVKINKDIECCDVKRIIDKLNLSIDINK